MFTNIKKQASSFVQEQYKSAKLALTDVTQAELLTEEAISSEPWGPDAKTMTRISEAAYAIDDYWRIVGIIHRRLQSVNYKEWRQSYKALVLLEFLLTHGPEDMFEEFQCDVNVIRELGKMNYLDERGFNWGACMRQKSERILKFLSNEALLTQARSKALRISKEIQGFGNLPVSSPTSTSSSSSASPSSASSRTSRASSFGSHSCDSPLTLVPQVDEPSKQQAAVQQQQQQHGSPSSSCTSTVLRKETEALHLWNSSRIDQEKGSFIDTIDEGGGEGEGYKDNSNDSPSWSRRFRSRFFGNAAAATATATADQTSTAGTSSLQTSTGQKEVPLVRSISNVGKLTKKKIDRQLSMWF